MRKQILTLLLLMAGAIAGCGDKNTFVDQPDSGGGPDPSAPVAATLQLLTSNPQLPSDGSNNVTITALARDANNIFIEGVPVTFSTDSGGLTVQQSSTDANGQATATLSVAGDPTNRNITVSGTSGALTSSVSVSVVGTTLAVTGPSSLVAGATATYTVVLSDAGGNGIAGRTVDVSSSAGSTLTPTPPLTTDSAGQAQFNLTASASDTLTVSALGITTTRDVAVSSDSFAFTSPAANTEVNLGNSQPLVVNLQSGGVPVSGEPISFSATRGSLSTASVTTDASGNATVNITSANAGASVITATTSGGVSTSLTIEFVATTPATIKVQANPFTIAPNDQSAITAIVRDASNNLVKNQTVNFSLDDTTGGQLSVASSVTDSQGRAQTFYTASSSTSAKDGVKITATVAGTLVTDTASLTVARREVFITIGTGNEIEEPNQSQYRIEFAVQVTDSQGNGVSGVTVVLSLLSEFYSKGTWFLPETGPWQQDITAMCADEDVNRNGILDAGEDFNSSGQIEAGNVASVVPGTATTDEDGFALVDVVYPQQFARWVQVVLEARTSVQGTESSSSSRFVLPIATSDVARDTNPPGNPSPFGQNSVCTDTN